MSPIQSRHSLLRDISQAFFRAVVSRQCRWDRKRVYYHLWRFWIQSTSQRPSPVQDRFFWLRNHNQYHRLSHHHHYHHHHHCYKTKVWTDFRVRVSGQRQDSSILQSTTDGDRHVTWKSCDRVQSSLEGLRVQKDREESRQELGLGMTSRDMGSSWCTHSVHMYSGD